MGVSRAIPDEPEAPGRGEYLEHEVSRMDTLAGIAIKYGVQISDIKRANSLVTDSQMFAHKVLLVPLAGRHMPPPVRFSGSCQRMRRTWTSDHQQNNNSKDSLESPKHKSAQRRTSLAMSSLQRYYGLTPQKGECGTEMSLYSNGRYRCVGSEPLPKVSPAPDATVNGFMLQNGVNGTKGNGATKVKQDGSIRRRQKLEPGPSPNEVDTQEDVFTDPVKIVKSLFPRSIPGIRLNMDINSHDSVLSGNPVFVDGFNSVRKSPSAPSFADSENVISMWSSSTWTLNHEVFTRPFLDGLPKPVSAWISKAALD